MNTMRGGWFGTCGKTGCNVVPKTHRMTTPRIGARNTTVRPHTRQNATTMRLPAIKASVSLEDLRKTKLKELASVREYIQTTCGKSTREYKLHSVLSALMEKAKSVACVQRLADVSQIHYVIMAQIYQNFQNNKAYPVVLLQQRVKEATDQAVKLINGIFADGHFNR